ncbi:MAG: PIN domain-containing protein [Solirubrobacteraceae bacterium]
MIVIDSSIAIAAFASWHEHHKRARSVVGAAPSLVVHSLLETYSVLTRLPEPHRVAATAVSTYLERQFSHPPIALDRKRQYSLVGRMAGAGIVGGAVYDALIAMTVQAHDATLVSLDARAARTYERCGVRFELLTP